MIKKQLEEKKALLEKEPENHACATLVKSFEQLENEVISATYLNRLVELEYRFRIELHQYSQGLPIYSKKTEVLNTILDKKVTILVAETGSGKSTQLVQYLLCSDLASTTGVIVCTQPRKVAAISLANHVAKEVESLPGKLVGYQVGSRSCHNKETQIIYMTDGILLRQAVNDQFLEKYCCVIVDEAHERSLHTDLLLGKLKACLHERDDLRVVITSATINPQLFCDYFSDFNYSLIDIKGRVFPVDQYWVPNDAENSDMRSTTKQLTAKPFLPNISDSFVAAWQSFKVKVSWVRRKPKGFGFITIQEPQTEQNHSDSENGQLSGLSNTCYDHIFHTLYGKLRFGRYVEVNGWKPNTLGLAYIYLLGKHGDFSEQKLKKFVYYCLTEHDLSFAVDLTDCFVIHDKHTITGLVKVMNLMVNDYETQKTYIIYDMIYQVLVENFNIQFGDRVKISNGNAEEDLDQIVIKGRKLEDDEFTNCIKECLYENGLSTSVVETIQCRMCHETVPETTGKQMQEIREKLKCEVSKISEDEHTKGGIIYYLKKPFKTAPRFEATLHFKDHILGNEVYNHLNTSVFIIHEERPLTISCEIKDTLVIPKKVYAIYEKQIQKLIENKGFIKQQIQKQNGQNPFVSCIESKKIEAKLVIRPSNGQGVILLQIETTSSENMDAIRSEVEGIMKCHVTLFSCHTIDSHVLLEKSRSSAFYENLESIFTKKNAEGEIESVELAISVNYKSETLTIHTKEDWIRDFAVDSLNDFIKDQSTRDCPMYEISLAHPKGIIKPFLAKYGNDLNKLKKSIGEDCKKVELNIFHRKLIYYGTKASFDKLQGSFNKVLQNQTETLNETQNAPECPSCLCVTEKQAYCLELCGHYYCQPCIQLQINCWNGKELLACASCGTPICYKDLERLSRIFYKKSKLLDLTKFVSKASDEFISQNENLFGRCKIKTCTGIYKKTEKPSMYRCQFCHTSICTACGDDGHPGESCVEAPKAKVVAEQERQDALKFLKEDPENHRLCPKCECMLFKDEGCNTVQCPKCHHYVCWYVGCTEYFKNEGRCKVHMQQHMQH